MSWSIVDSSVNLKLNRSKAKRMSGLTMGFGRSEPCPSAANRNRDTMILHSSQRWDLILNHIIDRNNTLRHVVNKYLSPDSISNACRSINRHLIIQTNCLHFLQPNYIIHIFLFLLSYTNCITHKSGMHFFCFCSWSDAFRSRKCNRTLHTSQLRSLWFLHKHSHNYT